MSNDWFRFKKFLIKQDRCAMKVSTDAVLLGAWCDLDSRQNVLDIGTGTGIIALMCAQRSSAKIVGVEIDSEAAKQAYENCASSQWKDRLEIKSGDVRHLKSGLKNFDLIVSNPPYFKDSLHSKNPERNKARHEENLPLEDLIDSAKSLMSEKGKLSIILPFDRYKVSESKFLEAGFHLLRITTVSSREGKEIFRVLAEWSTSIQDPIIDHISIYSADSNNYHSDYISLTKEFYL